MNIKNKIIKWLGGYTQNELIEKKQIEICRTEKPLFPISAKFAIDARYGEFDSNTLEVIKHNLCYQVADFMFKYNLLYYDEVTDCYIMHAKAYMREP